MKFILVPLETWGTADVTPNYQNVVDVLNTQPVNRSSIFWHHQLDKRQTDRAVGESLP